MTLDISILNRAKENAKKRGWPLSRYVNSVLKEYFAQTENQRKEMCIRDRGDIAAHPALIPTAQGIDQAANLYQTGQAENEKDRHKE